jgi:leucyl-tRNA synthetase
VEADRRDAVKARARWWRSIPSAKMSKSKKNVVDPVNIIDAYGADTARWFVLSDSPPERDVEWTASGAEAAFKHLTRVHRLVSEIGGWRRSLAARRADEELLREMHKAIHDVTWASRALASTPRSPSFTPSPTRFAGPGGGAAKREAAECTLVQLMSPMTPHLSEDLWASLGNDGLCDRRPWPKADPAMLVEDTVTLPIQVNGKRRSEITVAKDLGEGRG